jgi:hypothetical protein
MKVLVLLMVYWTWGVEHVLTLRVPESIPSLTMIMAQSPMVPSQPGEHPWERRLRQVEVTLIRQAAYGDQATKEAKEIIKDRTQRLEAVERWMQEQEHAAETAKQKAIEALHKAEATTDKVDANADKIHEVSTKVDAVASPWSWESLVKALGGPTVVAGVLFPLIFRKFTSLREELERNEALPGPNNPPTPSNPVPSNSGIRSIADLGLRNL